MASIAVGIAKAVGLTKVNSSLEGFNQGMGYPRRILVDDVLKYTPRAIS